MGQGVAGMNRVHPPNVWMEAPGPGYKYTNPRVHPLAQWVSF